MKRVLRLPLAMAGTIAFGLAPWSIVSQATAQVSSTNRGKEITLRSEFVTIRYHRQSGTMDIVWQDGHKLLNLTSRAVLEDGRSLTTTAYAQHDVEISTGNAISDASAGTAAGHEYTIRSVAPGMPVFLQHIWLYAGKPWIAVEAELDPSASAVGTRH